MQSKGFIRFFAIVLALVCIWQLSFTVVTSIQNKKAGQYAEAAAAAFQQSPEFSKVNPEDSAYILDSIRKVKSRFYTDSIASEKVFFGYTFKSVQNKEINLGLDLKGGMNVMLQVQLEDMVKALADNNQSPEFLKAVALAKERSVNSQSDFITLFAQAWKEVAPGKRLSSIFGSYEMHDRIKPESTDEEVIKVIQEESESAISNSFNVLRNRIDRFGVTQPSIQKLGNTGRILVELPGVKEPERVRKLLQGTASLEFWPTYDNSEIEPLLRQADRLLAEITKSSEETVAENAEASAEEEAVEKDAVTKELEKMAAEEGSEELSEAQKQAHPLLSRLQPSGAKGTACVGFVAAADTADVGKLIRDPRLAGIFPPELRLMWSVKPAEYLQVDNWFELIAIKAATRNGKATLDGGSISDAHVSYDQRRGGEPSVSMTMNAEGANIWARMTKESIGKQIAIVLDGTVYSYPTVHGEITGGSSEITGNFDVEEATDLVNVLKSGKLPAPATIVQEQVVGPSLGQESINAGLLSFIIAFCLVLLYMLFFYQGAGVAADIALLTNVLLLFGTLAAFGAVLTLPGIAGLVLTLGMAVDANVIIYERIKEELKAGKGLGKAIHDGYSNAYSAIIDGQVTTLLTGIVLFVFGSGPVKGFATTLIIGIITSVLTSIFITRLIFEARVSRNRNITFENNLTKNFLKNTHIDFVKGRRFSYIFSGALILIAIASISIKGFTYGVDFKGGRTYVVRFEKAVSSEAVRNAVNEVFTAKANEDPSVKNSTVEVKQFGGDSQMKITTAYKVEEESSEVDTEIEGLLYESLKDFYGEGFSLEDFVSTQDNPNGIISSDKVGATIANDIKRGAVISVILALLIIFAYIAFRFKGWTWGLGGVVSLAHTAIIVIGFFSLFSGILPFNLDVDQTFIAAILTIIGYAINDNVVIFDRIRENLQLHPNDDFKTQVNKSLNQTLTRTVNTSVSTLLPMVAIAIWGGESIRGLAVALILGIIIGTYASIMIGTPVMFDATVRKKKNGKK